MKHIYKAVICAALVVSANGATVSITPNPAAAASTSGGQPLVAGDLAMIGYFRTYTTEPTGAAAFRLAVGNPDRDGVLNYINQNFVPLGIPSAPIFDANGVAQAGFGTAGTVGITMIGSPAVPTATGAVPNVTFTTNPSNSLSAGGLPRGTRMFLLVFDDPTVAGAAELGVFSAEDAGWTLSPTAVNLALATAQLNLPTEAFRGAIGSLVLAPLVVIPEPATGLLGLLAFGLIARRRR
jgi:hypothetical protein